MTSTNDSAESKPDLKVVEPADASASASSGSEPIAQPVAAPPVAPPAPSRLPLILGIALACAVVWALWQGQLAGQLAGEVEALNTELAIVGAELEASRRHIGRVRVGVDDLAGRAQALSDLAHAEPGATAAGTDEPSDGAAAPIEPEAVDF